MAPLRRFYALAIAFATGLNARDCITHVRTVFLYSFGANLPRLLIWSLAYTIAPPFRDSQYDSSVYLCTIHENKRITVCPHYTNHVVALTQ